MLQSFYKKTLLLLLLVIIPCCGFAATKKAAPKPIMKLFYYLENKNSLDSFEAHLSDIDIVAPQIYSLDDQGILTGSINPTLYALAKKHKIKIMPLVTNDAFSRSKVEAFLDDPANQTLAIQQLVNEAVTKNYWGWQLDFEQIDASYQSRYSTFVANLYAALKKQNIKLSVAVIAKISDNPNDYPPNLWNNLIGVYDYASLAANSDFITVMSYDDPDSKGAIAPYAWLTKVLAYSLQYVPKEKLSLGVGMYYWQWNDTTGKRVGIGGYVGIKNVFKKHYVTETYSTTEQAPYLTYTTKGVHYTIWYENGRSLTKKIALIKQDGLYGFSAWALGLEVPNIYTAKF